MTDMNRNDSSNLDAVQSNGTAIPANRVMTGGALTVLGCTFVNGTTYYFPFGAQRSPTPAETPLVTLQLWWNAAITITAITVETSLFPATMLGSDARGPVQLSDFDTTAGFWLQQNPTTAYVPITGGTVTAMTANPTALTQGGCEFDLGNFGNRRGRVKVVVGATGGVVRCGIHGKGGT